MEQSVAKMDGEDFGRLIDQIYCAAIDPARRRSALTETCSQFRAENTSHTILIGTRRRVQRKC